MNIPQRTKLCRGTKTLILFLVLSLVSVLFYLFYTRVPLPTDQEMIEKFYKNKEGLDLLVSEFRNYDRETKGHTWISFNDNEKKLRNIGFERITQRIRYWVGDPYSHESADFIRNILIKKQGKRLRDKYVELGVVPYPSEKYRAYTLRFAWIWKDYVHFPVPPRVDKDLFYNPRSGTNKKISTNRHLGSLDKFPEDWKEYECVYRRIEPNWFLQLCNGH